MTNQITVKEMESQKKFYKPPFKGIYQLIAKKVGCHPGYVSKVLRNDLGKYSERDTLLTREIHSLVKQFEELFKSD